MLPPIVTFLIVLSIVVLIHELGHFLAAKWIGVKVEEFGWGYPPRALGKKIGETIYSINWLPFGGFVRLFGEQEADAQGTKSTRAFCNKGKRQRTLVILAGVVMNLLLGMLCFSFIYSVTGIPEEVNYVMVDAVAPNSPAQSAGLEAGQRILSINGIAMTQVKEFVDYIDSHKGQVVDVAVLCSTCEPSSTQSQIVQLTPRIDPPPGEGAVGVLVSNYDSIFYPSWQMPFRGAWIGLQETYGWTRMMLSGLGQMVATALQGTTPEVTGPVGIYQITSSVAKQGLLPLIKFIGILSINLAVVNILPFPALDGGRFVFIVLEGIIGKRIKPQLEAYVNMVGMILLIGLMVLVTVGDVMRLVRGA